MKIVFYKFYRIYRICKLLFLVIFIFIRKNSITTVIKYLPPANEEWGKVIFSEACVKNSVHMGACMAGGHAWQGACMAGGLCMAGGCV